MFNYIFEIKSIFPKHGDFAKNFTRFSIVLRCHEAVRNVYITRTKTGSGKPAIDLGVYKSRQVLPIIKPIREIWDCSWDICTPSITLYDVSGYLLRYNMVKFTKIPTLTGGTEDALVIDSASEVRCVNEFKNSSSFRLEAHINDHKPREVYLVVRIRCSGAQYDSIDLDDLEGVKAISELKVYAGMPNIVKVPESIITLSGTYFRFNLGEMEAFATVSGNHLTINPRDGIDDGTYTYTLEIYDKKTDKLLGKKILTLNVNSNGRNKPLCPFKNEE